MEKKEAQRITFSYDKYDGYENEEVRSLGRKLEELNTDGERIREKLAEIRDKCIHEYKFSASGMYEDAYTCVKCGKTTWR